MSWNWQKTTQWKFQSHSKKTVIFEHEKFHGSIFYSLTTENTKWILRKYYFLIKMLFHVKKYSEQNESSIVISQWKSKWKNYFLCFTTNMQRLSRWIGIIYFTSDYSTKSLNRIKIWSHNDTFVHFFDIKPVWDYFIQYNKSCNDYQWNNETTLTLT